MRLLLDVGNTRLKWGLRAGARWLAQGAFAHDEAWDFAEVLPPPGPVTGAFGVNVAGAAAIERLDAALAPWSLVSDWLRPTRARCGVENGYVDVDQLGADRWAALIGAWNLHRGACLVVTAGTATTIDVLDADGHFTGGLIAPGMDLMKRALAGNTAQLPLADGRNVVRPTCTVDAIHMGCVHAQAGAIERMFRQIADQPGACCLINGGAAAMIAPALGIAWRQIDNLVLEGVAVADPGGAPG
ncbi:MAG: type III pantothenate kinase [Rhodocyclaceae bacterium]|nr:type III pantothenate kinase [Rhodocyclaceae bacterium]